MKYCQNCGKQIDDSAKFCEYCGGIQGTTQLKSESNPLPVNGKQLHCPRCKDSRLSPIVETDVNGGVAVNRSFGKKWGASAINLNSTHRNYWMCQSCGHKFRNIDSLDEEIATMLKAQKSALIFIIIGLVGTLCYMMTDGGAFAILTFFCTILFICVWVYIKRKADNLKQEKVRLEQQCFN